MSSYPSRPVAAVKTAQTAASATSAAVTTTSKFLAVKRWVQDHPVMAVAALLAVGTGVTYYVQTTQASRGPSKGGRKAGGKPGKKAAKSDKSSSSPESASPSISTSQESLSNETDESALFPEDITALNETERKLLANRAKQHGNTYYARGDLKDAIRLYTQAIALHADPMFYSNRAACYLRTKQWLEVIADTSAALELAPRYVKAISRRAQAFEAMGMWNEALKDWTSLAVLEGFKVQSTLEASDRVIHQLAEARATELTQSRAKKLPSGAFVTAYMQAFHAHSPEALAIHLSLVPKTE
ncbi:TPR-like protein, partial [Caulochytrium protostelioides]